MTFKLRALKLTLLAAAATASCGSPDTPPGDSGGTSTSSGGSSGTAGSGGSTGGSGATGGTATGGTGGASGSSTGGTSTGGTTGGTGASGGTTGGTGGTTGGTGGTTGGSAGATGGSAGATGGSAGASGGRMGGGGGRMFGGGGRMGGAGTGAAGAPAAGGMSGSGGSAGTGGSGGSGGASPSTGCGKAPPMSQRYSIDVGGTMREYILSVPANYDQNKPYRLIFAWHPWGGSAQQVAGTGNSGYYGLKGSSMDQAVLVSPEGTDFNGQGLGWGNTNGQDIAFLEAMLAQFKSEMCIDEARVFSVGFSFGGMMSNAVGCAGLARAIAPMAGNATVSGCTNGTTPVAYMGFHGDHDSVVDISGGRAARDKFVTRNHCTTETEPANPDWCAGLSSNNLPCTCVSYKGCDPGYPVTWCEYNADHQAAPNSGPTLWTFFSQF